MQQYPPACICGMHAALLKAGHSSSIHTTSEVFLMQGFKVICAGRAICVRRGWGAPWPMCAGEAVAARPCLVSQLPYRGIRCIFCAPLCQSAWQVC